ncbi:XdhC family protein [Erythrobacter jejuensis]|uniref:XdhC family protein n=2 Tax=Parerythrobacter jejuensis TaxID=795812 RepID=A0A845AU25_9SPHN|nr:XdhC family protein [Parerythrobacter jejuensis]MXP33009.1 XdhC family protein [Parerythrobacter jejuensis]
MEVEGSSMRNPGTHMAVCEDGSFAGSLSGGCIENAVVAEALATLKSSAARIVRFGAGSPYLDIKLPCGGGLDIHFQPLDTPYFVTRCCAAIDARRPFAVRISGDGVECLDGWRSAAFDPETGTGVFGHWPQARLLIIGHGASVASLAKLGRTMDLAADILTPDDRLIDQLEGFQLCATKLARATDTQMLHSDPWTAIIFLFHDHDWETALMDKALQLPHFYIGAMGGRLAHDARRAALSARGITQSQLDTIRAPIGLFHSSRDPDSLALSALGEIVQAYQNADFEPAHGG